MKLKKNDKAVQKIRQERKNLVESKRQKTKNYSNTKEWREAVEERLEIIENELLKK